MASIYKKTPLFKDQSLQVARQNKRPKFTRIWANLDSSLLSTKQSMTSSAEQQKLIWTMQGPSWSSKIYSRVGTWPTVNRCFTSTFQNLSSRWWFRQSTINPWQPWSSNQFFLDQNAQQKAPGGDHVFHKKLTMMPMDHLHHFQELLRITKKVPMGNIFVQTKHYKWNGSTWASTRATAPNYFTAGISSAKRHCSPLQNTFRVFTMW